MASPDSSKECESFVTISTPPHRGEEAHDCAVRNGTPFEGLLLKRQEREFCNRQGGGVSAAVASDKTAGGQRSMTDSDRSARLSAVSSNFQLAVLRAQELERGGTWAGGRLVRWSGGGGGNTCLPSIHVSAMDPVGCIACMHVREGSWRTGGSFPFVSVMSYTLLPSSRAFLLPRSRLRWALHTNPHRPT